MKLYQLPIEISAMPMMPAMIDNSEPCPTLLARELSYPMTLKSPDGTVLEFPSARVALGTIAAAIPASGDIPELKAYYLQLLAEILAHIKATCTER